MKLSDVQLNYLAKLEPCHRQQVLEQYKQEWSDTNYGTDNSP